MLRYIHRTVKGICGRFGRAVQEARLARAPTQERLADLAGMHRTYLSDIERGGRNPSLVNIGKFAAGLGMALDELFASSRTTRRRPRPDPAPARRECRRPMLHR